MTFLHMADTAAAIAWLEWSGAAFARAAREDKPILLSLVAPWCEHCLAMDRETFARADIARLVETLFVPVRVNTDRRPDLNERYNLGGWPTTAFLTPAGDILGGGTFIDGDRMSGVLTSVAAAFVHRRAEIEGEPRPPDIGARRAAVTDVDPVAWLASQILELLDVDHGGFGYGAKFPHTPAVTLALDYYSDTGDPRYARLVTTSLEGMGRLHDDIEGGFFRYASDREWGRPQTEKILSDNAFLIRLHLDAGAVLQRDDFIERASRALRWVHDTLAARDGGFAASQAADGEYYLADTPSGGPAPGHARAESRSSRGSGMPPRIDRTQYTDSNAEMISTYLGAAEVTGDDWLREFAVRSLEQTVLNGYQPGAGIAHVCAPDPDVRGLLCDHVSIADALLRAHVATGRLPYSMLAAELMEYALGTMWDDERGSFHDRASDGDEAHGLLRRPLNPFATNCEAARMLSRLSIVTGRTSYRARAEQTLTSLGAAYRDDPLLGASYGLALREVRDGRLPRGLSLSYVDWKLGEPDDD